MAGILAGILFAGKSSFPGWAACLTLIPAVLLVFRPGKSLGYSLRWLPGLILLLATAGIAFGITCLHTERTPWPSVAPAGTGRMYLGEITEPPVQKAKTIKLVTRLLGSGIAGGWKVEEGKALLYIEAGEGSRRLLFGDRILFSGILKEPGSSDNPGGFDLHKACLLNGISRMGYIRTGHWKRTGRAAGFSLYSFAFNVRDRLLKIFAAAGLKGREFAVASALLFGYTDEIDPGLYADFSATGTIHILSVSGMHVGVIFLFLEKLLGFLNRFRYGSRIRSGIAIAFIWFYALLTGMSPAVLRAAVMLSLLITGKNLKRNPDLMNVLAASAVLLLSADPVLLLDIGFELSYLAVAGILLFYKPVYDLYVTSRWFPDKIWSLVAVSIAAQLATFPLSLYQFHRFPDYFIPANLVVVPLSTIIIYGGILVLIFSAVPFLSAHLALVLSILVKTLNATVHFIGNLPGSVTDGIFISSLQTLLIYGLLATGFLFLLRKRKFWLFALLTVSVFLSASVLTDRIRSLQRERIVVYSVRDRGLIDFIVAGRSILVRRGGGEEEPYFTETLHRYWQSEHVRNVFLLTVLPDDRKRPGFSRGNFFRKGAFIGFCGKRILVLDRKLPEHMGTRMRVDDIILSGNPDIRLKEVVRIFSFRQIIIDGSNAAYRIRQWKKEAKELQIEIYPVPEKGAWISE